MEVDAEKLAKVLDVRELFNETSYLTQTLIVAKFLLDPITERIDRTSLYDVLDIIGNQSGKTDHAIIEDFKKALDELDYDQ